MLRKVFLTVLVLFFLSNSLNSQILKIKPAKVQSNKITASSISVKDGEKLLVVTAHMFKFESPAQVTPKHLIYYVKRVLEIQSTSSTLMSFVAPVNLPEGARIKRIGMCFSDSTMKSKVNLRLIQYEPINPGKTKYIVAEVKSYGTGNSKKFAIAKSGPCRNAIVDIKKGYFFLDLALKSHNKYCKFAYAYLVYEDVR